MFYLPCTGLRDSCRQAGALCALPGSISKRHSVIWDTNHGICLAASLKREYDLDSNISTAVLLLSARVSSCALSFFRAAVRLFAVVCVCVCEREYISGPLASACIAWYAHSQMFTVRLCYYYKSNALARYPPARSLHARYLHTSHHPHRPARAPHYFVCVHIVFDSSISKSHSHLADRAREVTVHVWCHMHHDLSISSKQHSLSSILPTTASVFPLSFLPASA